MTARVEQIGDATLYLGNCLEMIEHLDPTWACVSDPPYGQNYKVNTFYAGGSRENAVIQRNGKSLKVRPNVYPPIAGDRQPFDPRPWLHFSEALLWGAHQFANRLPAGSWLIWDKVPTGKIRDQGDGEAAWLNRKQPLRIFRLLWDGLCVGAGARHEVTAGQQRLHPMQKPEALMLWCLSFIDCGTILDPYMGSGTTGVAALRLGRKFIGIEIEPRWFDVACRRIEAEARQGRLPIAEPRPRAKPQRSLFAEDAG